MRHARGLVFGALLAVAAIGCGGEPTPRPEGTATATGALTLLHGQQINLDQVSGAGWTLGVVNMPACAERPAAVWSGAMDFELRYPRTGINTGTEPATSSWYVYSPYVSGGGGTFYHLTDNTTGASQAKWFAIYDSYNGDRSRIWMQAGDPEGHGWTVWCDSDPGQSLTDYWYHASCTVREDCTRHDGTHAVVFAYTSLTWQ